MRDVIVVIAAVFVGASFLAAGGTKLAARARWIEHARGLGVGRPIADVVPWVELVIGAGLVAQFARRPLAIAAAVLLVAFSVLLAINLRAGRRPPCACFGALSAAPISATHLVRNAAFLAAAVIAML